MRGKVIGDGRLRVLLLVAVAVALAGLGRGDAALLSPVLVDANTGKDAEDVGASIGSRRAWAGFVQETAGAKRLYVSFAQDGTFRAPVFADRGNAVAGAALAGNNAGDALVVFTDGGKLYGRRLSNGQAGAPVEISAATQTAQIPPPFVGLHHRRVLAVNEAGAAVVCYTDNSVPELWAAVLPAGGSAWTRVGPLTNTICEDVGIDARGNAIVIGTNTGGHPTADRIVNGTLHSEEIDATGKDEPSVAVTTAGLALAFARVDVGASFGAAAYRKRDIAQDGAWESLGRVDMGALGATNENTEFPRAALTSAGKGIVTFRVNNTATNTARIHFDTVDAGAATPFSAPTKLADVPVGKDAIPVVGPGGQPVVGYVGTGPDGKELSYLRVFSGAVPGPPLPLDPGTGQDVNLFTVPSFVADTPGNFLALIRQAGAAGRVAASFGDYLPPSLAATATPAKVPLGQPVAFAGTAVDSFAAVPAGSIVWTFAAGSVKEPPALTGANVSARFVRPGANQVTVVATDRGGNRAQQTVTVTVDPAKQRITPTRVRRKRLVTIRGTGFVPGERVTITIKRPRAKAKRLRATPNANGAFRVRYRIPKKAVRTKYSVVSCQRACTVKAKGNYRVRR